MLLGLLSLGLLAALILQMMRRKKVSADDTHTRQRFFRLAEVDERMQKNEEPEWNDEVTLEEICVQFRNFAASRLHLYYSPELIRTFIASFAASRLTILQGISGTGKTSLVYAFGKFVENPSTIIPVQPSWRDRSDRQSAASAVSIPAHTGLRSGCPAHRCRFPEYSGYPGTLPETASRHTEDAPRSRLRGPHICHSHPRHASLR